MKTLTIRQPWASLVAAGVKTIETRSWSTRYRGPLAIHAGKARVDPLWQEGGWMVDTLIDTGVPVVARNNGTEWETMPLGAVVATCRLADVVPIDSIEFASAKVHDIPGGWLAKENPGRGWCEALIDQDQRPFGDFTPGRFAWLLEDVEPPARRCPTCWGQSQTQREREWHEHHAGSICDAAHGMCHTPWCRCECHTDRCSRCRGEGHCPPVPAKGRQGLWEWAS